VKRWENLTEFCLKLWALVDSWKEEEEEEGRKEGRKEEVVVGF
jgi:hypothetical protein